MAELQKEEIPGRIRQARIEAGLTQNEIAELLDVAMRTWQNYESHRVPWSLINQIAKITGKSPEWLLHGEPEPTPDLMGNLGRADQLDRIERRLEALEAKLDRHIATTATYIDESRRDDARRDLIVETVSALDATGSAQELAEAFLGFARAEPAQPKPAQRSSRGRPRRTPARS